MVTIALNKMVDKFTKKFPDMWFKPGDEFDGGPAILWSGEGSEIDGLPAFSYYADDPRELVYQMGVNIKLVKFAADHGLYFECNDPGTYLAYTI